MSVIQDKRRGELKGTTEMTETDEKSERRIKRGKKRKRQREKKKRQALVAKLNPGLGNKYSKERALKELQKSSKSGSGVTILKVRVTLPTRFLVLANVLVV